MIEERDERSARRTRYKQGTNKVRNEVATDPTIPVRYLVDYTL